MRIFSTCTKCSNPIQLTDTRTKLTDNRWVHKSCFDAVTDKIAVRPDVIEVTPIPEPKPESNGNGNGNGHAATALDVLAEALQGRIKSSAIDETSVRAIVETSLLPIEKAIDERFIAFQSTMVKTLEIKQIDKPVVTISNPHKDLETALYLINKGHHVYMWGPAGSGKSTAAKHCAEALNREWGYISLNPQTPESRILGFVDATGTYRESVFHKLYANGGVFCIDEMDNASPALLTTLNSLLENGHGAFPNGVIPRHKDFVLVATGNTNGKGANPAYPDRRAFDAAFTERFSFIHWAYDESMELKAAMSINPKADAWVKFIWALRRHCEQHHPRVLVTPRASLKGASYLLDNVLSTTQIAEMVIFKGLESGTVTSILNAVKLPKVG